MGPVSRYLGPWVPEPQLWQDPVPAVDHDLVDDADVAALKATILDVGPLGRHSWSRTAWASAASFRGTDKRGGANGARVRLAPQKDWEVNEPGASSPTVLPTLERIQQDFNDAGRRRSRSRSPTSSSSAGARRSSRRRRTPGVDVTVPFAPGRTDASQEQTDVESFAVLEPTPTGSATTSEPGEKLPPETAACSTGPTC